MDKNILSKMTDINNKLLEASEHYYQKDEEIMSNAEYDALYDELVELENKYGVLENSITQLVGNTVISKLEKDKHEEKALSLDKTKDKEVLVDWLKDKEGVLSWKLDGLTLVLTYDNGKLLKAVTRGNGEIGEIVTHNAVNFVGIPKKISFKRHLVIRGEALMTYSEFNKINNEISDEEAKYKNPRNLASGTIRQLDSKISKQRKINFKAFELVSFSDDLSFEEDTFENRFLFLKEQGFDVVEFVKVNKNNVVSEIENFYSKIENNDFPSDGLVLFFNDINYGKSLGTTSKFPRNGIAFKWQDEMAITKITDIIWQTSRTGLINPVCVFDSVELEGTTVSRATANNVSIIKKMHLSVGSKIKVYKANMIIPTIYENVEKNGDVVIPDFCPSCKKEAVIKVSKDGIETLNCSNPSCPAKMVKKFSHFVSRNAMNIVGLSEQTLEKFLGYGFISSFDDIYNLEKYKDDIINLDGFGEKSYNKLIDAIEKSKSTSIYNFIYATGISNIGYSTSRDICVALNLKNEEDFIKLLENKFDFTTVNNIGTIINDSIYEWYNDKSLVSDFVKTAKNLKFADLAKNNSSELNGKIFVITGLLNHFNNRDELKEKIELLGGKVASSVSNKTSFLINNDVASNSGKNKKAKELGIKIISEEDFLELIK